MNRHPGGEAQTLYLLENIEWKKEIESTGSWSWRRRHDTNPEITWDGCTWCGSFPTGQ